MINLRMTKKEATDQLGAVPADPKDAPLYPYGTSLRLDDETLLKLGLSELPAVGAKFTLHAVVEVTGVRSSQRQGEQDSSLDLQVTDMELGLEGMTNDERAKKLYPEQD